MKAKYKTTPFFRFIVFMIFFIPIGWLLFSYGRGKDPMDEAKKVWEYVINKTNIENIETEDTTTTLTSAQKDELIEELRLELQKCQSALKEVTVQ